MRTVVNFELRITSDPRRFGPVGKFLAISLDGCRCNALGSSSGMGTRILSYVIGSQKAEQFVPGVAVFCARRVGGSGLGLSLAML